MKKLIYYSPILLLVLGLLLKTTLLFTYDNSYMYDEILLTEISKQPLPLLLETVKADPHPPFFYIFLKLFPVDNPLVTRLSLMTISYLLLFLSLKLAYKYNLVKKYNLSIGLALFFASDTFSWMSTVAKQDIVSFPLLFLVFIVSLLAYNTKNIKLVLFAHSLSLVLLFIGYIPYISSLFILLNLAFYLKKNKTAWVLLVGQFIATVSFGYVWILPQLKLNAQRFSWFNYLNNSIIYSIHQHIVNIEAFFSGSDILTLIFIVSATIALYEAYKKDRDFWYKNFPIIFSTLALFLFYYVGKFYVQNRYAYLLIMILSILAGKTLDRVTPKMIIPLLLVYFSMGHYYIGTQISQRSRQDSFLAEKLQERTFEETNYGFISDYFLYPYVMSLKYHWANTTTIVPTNIDLFKNKQTTQEHLMVDAVLLDKEDKSFVKENLKETQLTNFFYVFSPGKKYSGYADPDKIILQIFDESCIERKLISASESDMLYRYENCSFEENS